jgi:uncharacterized protein (TIGR02246 family)
MSARPAARRQHLDPDQRAAAAAIGAIFTDMAEGFNRRDVGRADGHFTADAAVVTPDGRRIEGLPALLRYHGARLAGPARAWTTSYRILETVFVDDRVAVVHTAQDSTTPDGPLRNHGTFVVVNREGRWWVAAAHNTNVTSGPAPDGEGLVDRRRTDRGSGDWSPAASASWRGSGSDDAPSSVPPTGRSPAGSGGGPR